MKEKEKMMFGYWEYVGRDFEEEMRKMEERKKNKEWWQVCMK